MYVVKISGSRYVCSLENVQGQWNLRMKLDDVVEAEVPVIHMTKRALHSNMTTLFEKVNLVINSFQHDLLHKEIVGQITHLLAANEKSEGGTEEGSTKAEVKEDPRIEQLMSKIDNFEKTINVLNERLDRIEQLVSK